ncbi:MAG: 4a-hydroxytetrahydrobiopterin dehydratase [Bacteroidales bacterium]|nr:4a-hydroxytetrahydrobiopterin dehydratase [Bacteroidales bacterium]
MPCEGGIAPLDKAGIDRLLKSLEADWRVANHKIVRDFKFVNFAHAMDFANKVAEIAETEGHHPVITVGYGSCSIVLWTHAVNGLTENDFIVAGPKSDCL